MSHTTIKGIMPCLIACKVLDPYKAFMIPAARYNLVLEYVCKHQQLELISLSRNRSKQR